MAEKLEDLNLPISVVNRIVKEALPDGIAISKEARTGLAKVASVFVLYITSASTNIAKKANKKTLSGEDVLGAMEDIEFDKFIPTLREALEAFRKTSREKKILAKRKSEVTEAESEEPATETLEEE